MSGDEFRSIRERLGWSICYVAEARLGTYERQVRRWEANQSPVPEYVAAWMRKWLAFDITLGPPKRPAVGVLADGVPRPRGRPKVVGA